MKIKIAFFDIDGTLAKNNQGTFEQRIPDSTRIALEKLEENEIMCVISTGRDNYTIRDLIKLLNMKSYICCNGQFLMINNKIIHQRFLTNEQIKKAVETILKFPDIMLAYETTLGKILVDKNLDINPSFSKEYHKIDTIDSYKNYDVYQIVAYTKDMPKLKIEVEGIRGVLVSPLIVNIIPEGVSKAVGIEKMLKILNIDKSEAIAFGDGENDIEMFSAVGYSVAMGNGADRLKAVANYITDNVDSDGIYNACIKLNLIGK